MAEDLSASFVRTTKRPGKYPDGGNLYLQVTKRTRTDESGKPQFAKSWLFRYSRFGKDTWIGLGPYPDVSLKEARSLAREERRKKHAGIDPLSNRRARRQATRSRLDNELTFDQCAKRYVKSQRKRWRNDKHAAQWSSTLENYAGPVFGHIPVEQVDTPHVIRCLEAIWTDKTETASRLRGRIEAVLDWATVRGFRKGENPARWRGHLDKVLPKPSEVRKVKHYKALPYAGLPDFMVQLAAQPGVAARALEFTILTAARTGEVIAARLEEFDNDLWTVPADRMKASREHRVPLSEMARAALNGVPVSHETWVFPGQKKGSHIANTAMLMLLRRMGLSGLTVHGFRSTFRDWAAETTNTPSDVVEMALAHTIPSKVEAAYRRGDLLEKRRRLMHEWGRYCSSRNTVSAPTNLEEPK